MTRSDSTTVGRLFGAPLRVSALAVVVPILAGIGAARHVRDATLIDVPSIPDPKDTAAFSAAMKRLGNLEGTIGHPSLGWAVACGVGIVVAFVLSVLAHEIGHAAVARRRGFRIEATDLGLTGGFVTLRDPDRLTAGHLAAIAGAGPLVTATLAGLLAVALLLTGWPIAGTADHDTAAAVAAQTVLTAAFQFNAACLVLNLLPVPPLDGRKLWTAWRLWRTRLGN